ncbi:carbamoyl-phosphate synthase small subunit [Salirhabdus euzebyi]|uniref:Carbamoyl phosphate synthase small chain n=1 Tax=Salirhabdus euzebyi TaxID=394506 RepID=A0A841PWX8_9BACI|nr:carbamoyl phosphate synthase small subunit [Salirhabdus euzebyi]MBB6451876.1 carbamoyl-phosphate synthase small subunit [Salirhabdus euzebyi]
MEENICYLHLSTGDRLQGKWLHQVEGTEGEMVFNTAMTGYQEVMTDPSYAGQIVTMTYPLIGNYGFNDIDQESIRPFLSGLIIAHPCKAPDPSHSQYTLYEMATKYNIPVMYDIDTRALTTIIRKHGEVYGKMTTNKDETTCIQVKDKNLVEKVSVTKRIFYSTDANFNHLIPNEKHIVVLDFGYKHSIVKTLLELGCHVTVLPYQSSIQTVKSLKPDGVVLSNGPGDPKDLDYLLENINQITNYYPSLGICLGHQLIALAHGGKTDRLPFGHRGSNHPVKDLKTGKVWITSQNHGYVIESIDEKNWEITHKNVNDQSIEGIAHRSKPILSVQFHPEAHPGPADASSIFLNFINLLTNKGEKQHA